MLIDYFTSSWFIGMFVVNEAKYIQHKLQTHEGSEGMASLFQRLSESERRVNIVWSFEAGAKPVRPQYG